MYQAGLRANKLLTAVTVCLQPHVWPKDREGANGWYHTSQVGLQYFDGSENVGVAYVGSGDITPGAMLGTLCG